MGGLLLVVYSLFREGGSIGWLCFKCNQDLSGESIVCDSCLEWYDHRYAGIRKIPTPSTGFVRAVNENKLLVTVTVNVLYLNKSICTCIRFIALLLYIHKFNKGE